ncbi:MAG TPA: BON domain-containing protein [Desulfuromonadaceae bacterium]|jgi:osmotically-inducible protein OsmY
MKFISSMVVVIAGWLVTGGAVYATEMDERIEATARQSYVFKTYLKGDQIAISAKEGFVTLTGTVSEESHKKLAQETVSNLPGVINVENRLEVKGGVPVENSDTWIKAKVKTALMLHQKTSPTTRIYVNDGVVTLRGDADSQDQKEQISQYIRGIDGVKDVRNEMRVLDETDQQSLGEKIDDISVTAQVKVALLSQRFGSTVKPKVETNKGEVTLFGKAGSEAEKEYVSKLVSWIKGVKSVNNTMTISGNEK